METGSVYAPVEGNRVCLRPCGRKQGLSTPLWKETGSVYDTVEGNRAVYAPVEGCKEFIDYTCPGLFPGLSGLLLIDLIHHPLLSTDLSDQI